MELNNPPLVEAIKFPGMIPYPYLGGQWALMIIPESRSYWDNTINLLIIKQYSEHFAIPGRGLAKA
jgi:hypothetical protein